MKRKICLFLLMVIAFSVAVCGCNAPVVHITLSDGIYEFANNDGAAQIEFDLWDKTKSKTGSFCYTAGTAQVIQGPIEIEKGYVIGTDESDNTKYTFEIRAGAAPQVKNSSLAFTSRPKRADRSSATALRAGSKPGAIE